MRERDPDAGIAKTAEAPNEASERTVTSAGAVRGAARTPSATVPPPGEAPARFREGISIKQYEFIREIGHGGMGQVFLARDTRLGRRVAMKFLLSPSAKMTSRFLIEARATARCSHENIVVIYEADEHEGRPYMVLEYLEGTTLRALIDGRQLSAGRAVELMIPVVRALVRAHEFDIVHRDLKPENIFVTEAGAIKVLDFGIATFFSEDAAEPESSLIGTLPYMAPEQCGADSIDARSDLWAVGIMLHEMVLGRHPLAPFTSSSLLESALRLDEAMPRVASQVPDLPRAFDEIVHGCLAKRKPDRFASAQELLDALEPLLPRRHGRKLADNESPYPGLTAFQESDADRFYGRTQEVVGAVTRLGDRALVGVVGPSGAGKSSFVNAGLVPALKASGASWEAFSMRPGRRPLASLAGLLEHPGDHEAFVERLRREPGTMGALLRTRASSQGSRILLFVDQLEELYTHVADPAERLAFTACLAGIADDAAGPLRVVVSMRSDFLDRVGEDRRFLDELTRALIFLQPLGREGLSEALTQPVEQLGYGFESSSMVTQMVDALAPTSGALPLLQFAASRLWEARDRRTKTLTGASYLAMGGITGALATHADQVVRALPPSTQNLTRALFQRLVTSERTRAVVDASELSELSADPAEVPALIDHLAQARLLVVQGPAIELVHESLITNWPMLRRWLDEGHEDAAYLMEIAAAARQWDAKGRPQGLLWRGEALDEARHWNARYKGEVPARSGAYLNAAFSLASRARRVRRALVTGTIAFLLAAVAAGAIALFSVRRAERTAVQQATRATSEARRARDAEAKVREQLDVIQKEQAATLQARGEAEDAHVAVGRGKVDLAAKNRELEQALARSESSQAAARTEAERARAAETKAQALAGSERDARENLEKMYAEEKARNEKLEQEKRKINADLK